MTPIARLAYPGTSHPDTTQVATPQLEIAQLGRPVLREHAQPIENPQDPSIQTLIDRMLTMMEQAGGVGIAAPQIGVLVQLMIVASRPTPRYPHAPKMAPIPMLNPRLVSHEPDQEKGWEGCLSVPGIRGLVPRYSSIEIAYLDRTGQPHTQVLEGFVARIFQHEYDHLQGVVFLDRVEQTTELMSEQEYHRQIVALSA
ncbi:MAG: peptide deformylase [Thermosynechococcaceae cyanobacterium MS004]|nr:peptide deformylase [Thermosynechococcaceae cyanobacterium MS004]